jgi:tRNA pseudouridine55 synthase
MDLSGFFLIHKPIGITSHDVVYRLRKITGEKTIGHAGTLDPFAEGLLILAVGRQYTKQISSFAGMDKEYTAEAVLGATSTTYDRMGELTPISDAQPSKDIIENVLEKFRGTILQTPPIYSAKKIGGRKAYDLARAGQHIEMQPVEVTIHSLKIITYAYPVLTFATNVSKGTYIRSLAHDIGRELGTGAYLQNLIRTSVGPFKLANALKLDEITDADMLKRCAITALS